MFLCNYADILTDLDLDAMVRRLPRQRRDRRVLRRARRPIPSTWSALREGDKVERMMNLQRVRHADERRLHHPAAGDLRQPVRGRGAGHRGLRAADRAEPALRPPARRLLDADGHLQGKAGARRPAWRAATRRGRSGRRAGRMLSLRWPDLRTRPRARGAQRRHRDRRRRDAAAAGAREPGRAHRLGGAGRQRARAATEARASRRPVPARAPARRRCCSRASATGISRRNGPRSRPSSRR